MQAMLFAAGLGTRLKDETADKPKALVDVGGKPLLQHAIEKLSDEGASRIVVNVHHFAPQVINFINSKDWGVPVLISDESNKLLETGGGLKFASHLFTPNEPILIYNVDILSNINLQDVISAHKQSNAIATLVVRQRETQRYFKFDSEHNLVGWINKKTSETKVSRPGNFEKATEMAFSGIHIVEPQIFDFMPAEDRFSIVQVYLELAKTKSIKGYFDTSELWMDVGKPAQLEEARRIYGS
ncbi:Nucleotidyl transferase [Draconibacterium orientale]|uniref:Nucleotidyl transferase n=1 Tax=Draconibacterium orientale TaxID=1168034 RepID=X5D768_9BACT|nr:nucleotidyltransferase family protein [Draconibacterium orientale]AHW58493.1 nucleotidyltransferase [Draconibacterium orientale]SEU07286.1 Nucleotidyl transferase [Draconibacterium orientale]